MDLKTLVNRIPRHLMASIKNIHLSPDLGYGTGRFETAFDLKRWLESESAELFQRSSGKPNVTLEQFLMRSDKLKPRVIDEIRVSLRD